MCGVVVCCRLHSVDSAKRSIRIWRRQRASFGSQIVTFRTVGATPQASDHDKRREQSGGSGLCLCGDAEPVQRLGHRAAVVGVAVRDA